MLQSTRNVYTEIVLLQLCIRETVPKELVEGEQTDTAVVKQNPTKVFS